MSTLTPPEHRIDATTGLLPNSEIAFPAGTTFTVIAVDLGYEPYSMRRECRDYEAASEQSREFAGWCDVSIEVAVPGHEPRRVGGDRAAHDYAAEVARGRAALRRVLATVAMTMDEAAARQPATADERVA